jgi:hypothetical protein
MMESAGLGAIRTFGQKKTSPLDEIPLEILRLYETMDSSNNGVWLMMLGTFSLAVV